MPPAQQRFSGQYTDLQIEAIVTPLRQVCRSKVRIGVNRLKERLLDLMTAVGRTPITNSHHVRASSAKSKFSPVYLAGEFKELAKAENPLAPRICSKIAFSNICALARTKWAARNARKYTHKTSLPPNARWEDLSDWEQSSVREIISELAGYFRNQVRAGTPQKNEQDTLMLELANIFAETTGLIRMHPVHKQPEKLGPRETRYFFSASIRSAFIRFCNATLTPFFQATLVSIQALSMRWRRLEKHMLSKPKKLRPARPKIRKRPNPRKLHK